MKGNYIFALLVVLFYLTACSNNHDHNSTNDKTGHSHIHKEETEYHKEHNHEYSKDKGNQEERHSDEIILDPDKVREIGIETIEIKESAFNGIIKVTGEILPTKENEITVVATVPGRVKFLKVLLEGSDINKNQSLLTINSSELEGGNISEKAKIKFEIAQKDFNRIKDLYSEKIISENEYNISRQIFEEARINYNAIGKDLTENGKIISAPISGFVKNCLVKEGEYVQTGQPLLTVTNDRKLYLKAEVPEKYYNQIYSITSANFQTSYNKTPYNLEDLNGEIVSIGKASGEKSFYIPITFSFMNNGSIIPGSYAEVFLKTSDRKNVISLPLCSIIEEQGNYFIYKQVSESCYKKSEISLGTNDGINVEIKEGVCEGEKIVIKGAYQIKLASAVGTIPAHSHEH